MSLSARVAILEYACPILGIFVGNWMFTAPYKDLKASVERGYLGDLNPMPWGFMLGNCCGWVMYSILKQNLFIFFGNAPGFCLSVWLNIGATKVQYNAFRNEVIRQSLTSYMKNKDANEPLDTDNTKINEHVDGEVLALEAKITDIMSQKLNTYDTHETLVMIMVLFWVGCISTICFSTETLSQETREFIVGLITNLNLIFFYGSPLSTIRRVLRTRDCSSIHIMTMTLNTLNGTFWCAYGLAIWDPFVFAPNGLGAGLGVVQICLCFIFPRRASCK